MHLTLGFSPCPNDTFIFDALIHHKIDTEGLTFDVHYQDVETLNQGAFRGDLSITKLSYFAFAHVTNQYQLLDAGSALGFGVGPLLITKHPERVSPLLDDLQRQDKDRASLPFKVAIPGQYTTAHFLLSLAFPRWEVKKEVLFSEIENLVRQEEMDFGVIIHENRFTYEAKGLHKVIDLGAYWESKKQLPIPLGGIVVKKDLDEELKQKINRVLRKSIQYAFDHPKEGLDYIRSHAQEMEDHVISQHIELYVNDFSLDLGATGKLAIRTLFEEATSKHLIPFLSPDYFLNP
jgi:1,4-dihydroxy-6-naphthoate synthase